MTEWKWIRIDKELYNDIAALGKFNQSFRQVLRELVDLHNEDMAKMRELSKGVKIKKTL